MPLEWLINFVQRREQEKQRWWWMVPTVNGWCLDGVVVIWMILRMCNMSMSTTDQTRSFFLVSLRSMNLLNFSQVMVSAP